MDPNLLQNPSNDSGSSPFSKLSQETVPPQVSQPSQPPIKSSGSFIKILFIILGFAAVGIFGYYGYLVYTEKNAVSTPPPDTSIPTPVTGDESTWQILTNTKYDFTLGYPEQYTLAQVNASGAAVTDGEFIFIGSSKEDSFTLEAATFSGTLNQFMTKYLKSGTVNINGSTYNNIGTKFTDTTLPNNLDIVWYKDPATPTLNAFFGLDNTSFFMTTQISDFVKLTEILSTLKQGTQISSPSPTPTIAPSASSSTEPSVSPLESPSI